LMRFLLRWQRVAKNTQLIGADGLLRIVEQLQGFETAAGAWEREVLPARLHGYDQTWLDQLCLAGQTVWCPPSPRPTTAEPDAAEASDTSDSDDSNTAPLAAADKPTRNSQSASATTTQLVGNRQAALAIGDQPTQSAALAAANKPPSYSPSTAS